MLSQHDNRARLLRAARFAALGLLLAFVLFPIAWTILTSFKFERDIITAVVQYLPSDLTLSNYTTLWERSDFPRLILNSAAVAAMTVAMCLTFATTAAYSVSRYRFRGRTSLLLLFLSIRMFPFVMLLIPLFIILRNLGLLDSRFGLALAYTTFLLPVAIWFLKNFFDTVPLELEDAARVDGCTRIGVLVRIILPLSRPGIAATGILVGIGAWNEFLFALLLTTSTGSRTWPVGLQLMVGEFQLPFGQLAAGAILTMIPVLIAFLLAGRHIMGGLMAGALKG